ncbi:dihydroxyacetone kinase [Pullulanibacillus pueri]|uniref:DhaKLM operon coactivator DhaQ n=1 Tax=Pullulanibacillus pueri TaxID=1437324 RepID=A0A8J2ZZ73_9BACL|nr:DhaKLM operon coactivator DhaQ [Pullulanibacillus pueri]MBM7683918.1 dihydroxyacetone kinase [Pullulanibacillus pueri]GGH87944.1 DhaKLM operon coactivator DhaQ [Pullulanibacillus pueri]
MKKILNDVDTIVQDMLQGFYFEHKHRVAYDAQHHIIYQKDLANANQDVAIISGGGSGHEPDSFGYVGEGMLSLAVNGQIFVPPTPEQVLAAIRLVNKDKGILLIIKNFQADVENFLAAEARAKTEGRQVDHVIVNDDVSIEDDASYNKRKRGVAGTVFVHKIVGAAAREGYSLQNLKAIGEAVVSNLHTLGVALTPAMNPTQSGVPFTLEDNEVYYGIGIHGEKGYRKEAFFSSEQLAIELVNKLKSLYRWEEGDAFALMINGLGATPLMEQYIFANDIRRLCALENINVTFVKVGTQLTSLDMKGISLSFLKIDDPNWEKWLKAEGDAPHW